MIGIGKASKRIVSKSALKKQQILGSIQDGSREFITCLACINADGLAIPPALIYQGTSGDLQDVWLEDFDHEKECCYFTSSAKGWTSDELGYSWLTKVFEPNTAKIAGRSRRLLLVDGHSSHVNTRFIDFCDLHRIILVVLPPHSTHRLQPLDVGVFGPLAHYYSKALDQHVRDTMAFSRVTKRVFYTLFKVAWA